MKDKKIEEEIRSKLRTLRIAILIMAIIIIAFLGWILFGNITEDSYQQGAIDGSNSIVGTILQGVATCRPFEITFSNQTFQLTDVRCLQDG